MTKSVSAMKLIDEIDFYFGVRGESERNPFRDDWGFYSEKQIELQEELAELEEKLRNLFRQADAFGIDIDF